MLNQWKLLFTNVCFVFQNFKIILLHRISEVEGFSCSSLKVFKFCRYGFWKAIKETISCSALGSKLKLFWAWGLPCCSNCHLECIKVTLEWNYKRKQKNNKRITSTSITLITSLTSTFDIVWKSYHLKMPKEIWRKCFYFLTRAWECWMLSVGTNVS